MSDTTANQVHVGLDIASFDLPAWKKAIGGVCAVLLAILFFVSGAWKLTDPFVWSQALAEFRVMPALTLPGTLALGVAEMVGAVLILVNRPSSRHLTCMPVVTRPANGVRRIVRCSAG